MFVLSGGRCACAKHINPPGRKCEQTPWVTRAVNSLVHAAAEVSGSEWFTQALVCGLALCPFWQHPPYQSVVVCIPSLAPSLLVFESLLHFPTRDTTNVLTHCPTALIDAWLHGGFLNEPVPEGTRVILHLRARVQPDPGLYGTEDPCLAVIAIFGLFSAKATAAHPVSRCKVRMNDDDRSCQAVRCCLWESSLSCIPSCPLCAMEYSISNPLS